MPIRSFCTPVVLMACVATIPGPGEAYFRKKRYMPTAIAAVIIKLINPFMRGLSYANYTLLLFRFDRGRVACAVFGNTPPGWLAGRKCSPCDRARPERP